MKNICILIILSSLLSCTLGTHKYKTTQDGKSVENIYIIDSLKNLINKKIKDIKSLPFPKDIKIIDTVFESEGESWNGLVLVKKSDSLIVMESSWQDTTKVKRIFITNKEIGGSNYVRVGTNFKDAKSLMSRNIPSVPDGYFALDDKNKKNVTYFFNIGKDSNLYYGKTDFDHIPDSITIKEILIE